MAIKAKPIPEEIKKEILALYCGVPARGIAFIASQLKIKENQVRKIVSAAGLMRSQKEAAATRVGVSSRGHLKARYKNL